MLYCLVANMVCATVTILPSYIQLVKHVMCFSVMVSGLIVKVDSNVLRAFTENIDTWTSATNARIAWCLHNYCSFNISWSKAFLR